MRIDTISLTRPYHPKTPVAACIGYFDGIHKGHQELIRTTVEKASALNCGSALITFDPDPWVTIKNILPSELEHLTTMKQKNNLFIEYGIKNIYYLDFTREMSELSPEEFVKQVLGQLNLKALICGYDFHFGSHGAGDADLLKSIVSYPVEVVQQVSYDGERISSTRIVQYVKNGDFLNAYKLLGHPFTMDGTVVSGSHIGRTMGVPTANIRYSPEYVIPKIGVYSAHVVINGKKYGAMVNVGHNPTVNYHKDVSIEAHIFDLNEDLYGSRISVIFEQYIRDEMQFRTEENLKMQLEMDKAAVRRLLGL